MFKKALMIACMVGVIGAASFTLASPKAMTENAYCDQEVCYLCTLDPSPRLCTICADYCWGR